MNNVMKGNVGVIRQTPSRNPVKISFRRCRRRPVATVLVGELPGQPEIVMLLRPVEIDLAAAHGLERTLHPERADIDVAKDQRDEQNGHAGVHYLGELHAGDVDPGEEGEQQQKARYRHGNAGSKGKPIDKLLAQVKASGGRVFVLNEAAALLDPVDVDLLQKIIP